MRRGVVRGAVLVAAIAVLAWPSVGAGSNTGFFVGFSDVAPMNGGAAAAAPARQLGAAAFRFTLQWAAGENALSSSDATLLDRGVAATSGMRVVLSVYGTSSAAPVDATQRSKYCAYVADALRREPSIHDVVIWNEPNKTQFWSPQAGAPAAYEALLAQCYDTLHAVNPAVNVIGFALSHDGADNSSSTSPGAFIRAVGDAYRASGRTSRIFDTVAFHPYPLTTTERPWAKHVGQSAIGEGDWNKLMYNLWLAFNGTAQPIPGSGGVTIWYTEDGFQSTVPAAKASLYSGIENVTTLPETSTGDTDPHPADTSPAPDQATQFTDALDLASCQPDVGAFFNFMLVDESPLAGWQSGPLYPDLTQKASFPAFQSAIGAAASGSVACSSLKGGQPSSDFMPPSTPANLVAAASAGPLQVALTWSPASDDSGAVTYRIYRNGSLIATSTSTSYTDTAVAQMQTYTYSVRAIDAAANLGGASNAAQVTTPDATPPSTPSPLTATAAANATQVDLTWGAATDNVGVTGYEIDRGGVAVATTEATSWSDTSVAAGHSYDYGVVALDAAGNRSAAATASATVPAAPAPAPAPAPSGGGGGGGGGGGSASIPNLGVTLSASTTTPALGGEVDLTATIVNRGGAGSLQTHLVIALPATATLLGAPAYQAGSGCTGTQTVDCFLDYIPNGGTTHVWFNVRITGDASLTATASADRDSDPSDNAATIALTVPTAASVTHAPAAPAPTKGKVLVGNARANRLVGTPRNDMLNGRGGNDVLIGLGGNDTLIGGPGNDTIYARDGKRDVIDCGTGKDVVYADRYDKVAANCEVVHRS